ncbi:MAG: DUF1223 domain-containing protein [Rhizobiaceae bacterium]|nr:DUF1223 domain-containing protein [Rhizobiaceae bacterium]
MSILSIRPLFMVAAVLAAAISAGHAAAGETLRSKPIGVVELFTSQGCSNCPKADRAIEQLAGRDDVVTVAYHVDYWNYMGWQDTLSAKENTERQYGYAKTLGIRNVFTPQIVLNGVRDTKLTDADRIADELGNLRGTREGLPVDVAAELSHDEMTIDIGGGPVPGVDKADVVIAYFRKHSAVEIQKGENQGKKIVYRNAVTKLETVGMWEGKALTVKLPAALLAKRGFDGCAILLQAHDANGNPRRIVGAAAL